MRGLSRGFAAGIVACKSSAGPTGACGGGWWLREVVARGLDARETPAGTPLRAPIAVPRGNEPVTRNDSDVTTLMPREPEYCARHALALSLARVPFAAKQNYIGVGPGAIVHLSPTTRRVR